MPTESMSLADLLRKAGVDQRRHRQPKETATYPWRQRSTLP